MGPAVCPGRRDGRSNGSFISTGDVGRTRKLICFSEHLERVCRFGASLPFPGVHSLTIVTQSAAEATGVVSERAGSGAGFVDHFFPDAFGLENEFDEFAGGAFAAVGFGGVVVGAKDYS